MIAKFIASIAANVSEELLVDLFKVIVREITLHRKKADIDKLVVDLKVVIDETTNAEMMSDVEKNIRLSNAGRAVVERLRRR